MIVQLSWNHEGEGFHFLFALTNPSSLWNDDQEAYVCSCVAIHCVYWTQNSVYANVCHAVGSSLLVKTQHTVNHQSFKHFNDYLAGLPSAFFSTTHAFSSIWVSHLTRIFVQGTFQYRLAPFVHRAELNNLPQIYLSWKAATYGYINTEKWQNIWQNWSHCLQGRNACQTTANETSLSVLEVSFGRALKPPREWNKRYWEMFECAAYVQKYVQKLRIQCLLMSLKKYRNVLHLHVCVCVCYMCLYTSYVRCTCHWGVPHSPLTAAHSSHEGQDQKLHQLLFINAPPFNAAICRLEKWMFKAFREGART